MASRRISTKYQLSVEQVRTRIKLKNTTNFVRKLVNDFVAMPEGGGGFWRESGAAVIDIVS